MMKRIVNRSVVLTAVELNQSRNILVSNEQQRLMQHEFHRRAEESFITTQGQHLAQSLCLLRFRN